MKNLWLLLFILLGQFLKGQDIPYTFHITNQSFEALNDGIPLNDGNAWDEDFLSPVSFNFNFKVNNQDCSSVNVWPGGITFVGEGFKKLFVFHSPFGGVILKDKGGVESLSPISYKETIIGGNRVLIIEWENAGFIDTPGNTVSENDFVTFQVWLVENLNLIKVVYGPSHSTLDTYSSSGGAEGPFTKLNINDSSLAPTGLAANPAHEYEDCSVPCYAHIIGTPPENMVYNFSLATTSANIVIDKDNFSIYPNPVKEDYIIVETKHDFDITDHTVYLLDAIGNEVLIQQSRGAQNIFLELDNAMAGIYFVVVKNSKGEIVFNHKVLKM